MKKLKFFCLSALMCLLCICFAACGKSAEGKYVDGSLEYDAKNYSFFVSVDYSFQVELPTASIYDLSYKLTVTDNRGKIVFNAMQKSTVRGLGKQTHSGYESIDFEEQVSDSATFTVKVSDITLTKQKNEDEYASYAIGFGVTGGVLLIGATAYFIVTKAKEKN